MDDDPFSRKIGDISTCPNCMTVFRQQSRLGHHALQKLGKEVLSGPDLADSLWVQDRTLLGAARKEGRSHTNACGLARRHDGWIIGRVCSFFGRRLLFDFV